MPRHGSTPSIIQVVVTPRFEIFYALQSLQGEPVDGLREWQRETRRKIARPLRKHLETVAPTPLLWPLLADALRDAPVEIGLADMVAELNGMEEAAFQRAILSGVFKGKGSVDALLSGNATLAATVALEARTQERLLSLLGLHPFKAKSPVVSAFERLVYDPASYRDDVLKSLQSFWESTFADTWNGLAPQVENAARALEESARELGPEVFAKSAQLPIAMGDSAITSVRGATRVPLDKVDAVYITPSAFNTARMWAAYSDNDGRTRFFIPLLDPSLAPTRETALDPLLIFAALGDRTRYAMASTIARKPTTSVDLARVFKVSKPTISHHVQLLRAAGLLEEKPAENGVLLSLKRRILERLSSAIASEMFSKGDTSPLILRSRRANRK